MNLYRAAPKDGIVWITGGSSGIGRALAIELVRRGWRAAVSARKIEAFDSKQENVPDLESKISIYPCDVTNAVSVAKTVTAITKDLGPIALAIFNAGNYIPITGNQLAISDFSKTFDVNFMGVINGLVPVVEHMKETGRGQIAVTGSVTSYGGLPTAAAYGASKAALNSMAQSLKFDLDRMNIRIQIINPGFVVSELTKKNEFAMPTLMKTEDAVLRIVKGLESGGFEITFPKRLSYILKVVNRLPFALYFWLVAKATGADKPL